MGAAVHSRVLTPLLAVTLLGVAAQSIDLATSLVALRLGGAEVWPPMAWIVGTWGVPGFAAVKGAILVAVTLLILAERSPLRARWAVALFLVGSGVFADYWNLSALFA